MQNGRLNQSRRGISNDYRGKAVLITGGTKGIGLATGLAFAGQGAQVYLTFKWGSADEEAVHNQFAKRGVLQPCLIEADAAEEKDTQKVMETIGRDHEHLEVLVSNVSFAYVGGGLEAYKKRNLLKSLDYSAWPFVGYLQAAKATFSHYPRYVVGLSCDGPETYYPGYDFVAVTKSVMEVFCRYIASNLFEEDVRINVLRARPVSTDSLRETFGEDFEPFLKKYFNEKYFIDVDAVGEAILALCSGWMDAVSGQVILLDNGVSFCDNLMRVFEHRADYGLTI
jgi:enoyl-[acyl-carrier-protein] reductase (NADH)